MAGRGSDGCGVQLHHSFAELREVASEECPTGITELGVQPAECFPIPRECDEQCAFSTSHMRYGMCVVSKFSALRAAHASPKRHSPTHVARETDTYWAGLGVCVIDIDRTAVRLMTYRSDDYALSSILYIALSDVDAMIDACSCGHAW